MKTILSLGLAFLGLASAQAQIFRPAAVNGALIGGLAGAIIGNNSGNHNGARGAVIGATAGLLIGASIDDSRGYGYDRPSYRHRPAPRVYVYRDTPYRYSRPDYRGSGVFYGGLGGAIIGHNSRGFRHNAWRGAAWGAGLGYVFGSIAEENARYREAAIERPPVYIQSAPAAPAAPQNVTIINNYYNAPATPMTAANGLFGRN